MDKGEAKHRSPSPLIGETVSDSPARYQRGKFPSCRRTRPRPLKTRKYDTQPDRLAIDSRFPPPAISRSKAKHASSPPHALFILRTPAKCRRSQTRYSISSTGKPFQAQRRQGYCTQHRGRDGESRAVVPNHCVADSFSPTRATRCG